MRKVLFLMFLLLLMGLGAAGVKAQVRIGGNTPPNPAAALDLNADDTNSGAKGLALPRVSLTDVSTPLTGSPVVNGMMVYNINSSTAGGRGMGIYYWVVDSSKWVKVSDGSFLAKNILDSTYIGAGKLSIGNLSTAGIPANSTLISSGSGWGWTRAVIVFEETLPLTATFASDSQIGFADPQGHSGIGMCYWDGTQFGSGPGFHYGTTIYLNNSASIAIPAQNVIIRCLVALNS